MSRVRKLPLIGEVIEVNDRAVFSTQEDFNPLEVTVTDLLSTQFVCEVGSASRILFYKDLGDSWRFKK